MGLSDAGAHCGAICDGGTPTFMLTHWARDRTRGPTLPLEYVVHRQTRQTAELYGLARSRPGRARDARRPQRHRPRRAVVRPAADGVRPPGAGSPPRAASDRLPRRRSSPASRPSPTTSSPASSPAPSSAAPADRVSGRDSCQHGFWARFLATVARDRTQNGLRHARISRRGRCREAEDRDVPRYGSGSTFQSHARI